MQPQTLLLCPGRARVLEAPEVVLDHREGDVEHRHALDRSLRGPGMSVPVEDQIGAVADDRIGQPGGAEEAEYPGGSPCRVAGVGA